MNGIIQEYAMFIDALNERRTLRTKADAMAETINAIAGLCTYQHESKEDFIGRVRAVLGDDPDLRVSSVRKERDDLLEQLKQVEALSEVRLSQRDELLAALELMLERISEPPEANCSCHLSPPCADCIDFGGEREAFEEAKSAIASVKVGTANTAADGWIEWKGGACPVDGETIVQCKLREPEGANMKERKAKEWSWKHCSDFNKYDIIAYRVVKGGAA